jgi:two-component system, NtrC family, sensor kinase
MTRRSLGFRMVLLFGALLAAIGVFMIVFFPARMADQAHAETTQRAISISQVMATALGPAVEFDDADNAKSILCWLDTVPDAEFALVHRANQHEFATWHDASIPPGHAWHDEMKVEQTGDRLMINLPIRGHTDGKGTLHVGFSLAHLADQQADARETVALTSALVFAVGLLGTLLFAAIIVRPIRALSSTARKIATGKLPPVMPDVQGGDEITELAASLRAMLEKVHHESQAELVAASRHAGMAEVATGVLHNVGNVLTSVNVSLELLRERTQKMPIERLVKLHDLLGKAPSLDKEKLEVTRNYVGVVAESFAQYQRDSSKDLLGLANHVDHIKRVVSMQNAYARVRSVVESAKVTALIHEAIELGCPPQRRRDIALTVDIAPQLEEAIQIDRHRVLQILVNLISNARDAVTGRANPTIQIVATRGGHRLAISVNDNGVGITEAQMPRVFSAGFTSKPQGHGYGLHSSALTARQLGGALGVESEGEGLGARFTLTVPIEEAA